MKKIWNWLLIENNRKVLSFLGSGLITIVAAFWTYFTYFDQTDTRLKNDGSIQAALPTTINIGATWREIYPNPGSISQITQDGNSFSYITEGAIQGSRFQSSGRGIIKGVYFESSYQSNIPSTGKCSGSVSPNKLQTKSTCVDSVYGQFETVWVRQK